MNKAIFKRILALGVLVTLARHAGAEGSIWDTPTPPLDAPKEITVYRSPTCGCCEKWMEHMRKHGFTLRDIQSEDMNSVKQKLGVPRALQSCHTAVVDGYVIEGHVPAGDVKALLNRKPAALGLSAPGMPVGSPGMEMGDKRGKFAVILFGKTGKTEIFHEYFNQ